MKKRHLLVIGAAAVIGLAGSHVATAHSNDGMPGAGYGSWRNASGSPQALDEKTIKAREQFLAETTAARRQLAIKKAELKALMARENPEEKKVAQLTGEIFDLRGQLRQKALDSGLPGLFGMGFCRNDGMGEHRRHHGSIRQRDR